MNILDGFVAPARGESALIGEMTLRMVHALTECAVLSYKPQDTVRAVFQAQHPDIRFEWLEAVGKSFDSQAFACAMPGHVIIAFRGTESIQDFLTDAAVLKRPFKDFSGQETNHCVHAGFQRALNALWSDNRSARRDARKRVGPALDDFLKEEFAAQPTAKLWLCGHSLGAALATIAAARIQLTAGAPFQGRIGGLLTIGSPRVFNRLAAEELEASLGEGRVMRIYRSMDPVSVVPFVGFDHVSGERRAFVSRDGKLVVGARGFHKWLDRAAAALYWTEDYVGSMIPGQHASLSNFIAHHSSDAYLLAVSQYSADNRLRYRDSVVPIAVPLAKLAGFGSGGWAIASTTPIMGWVVSAKAAIVQLLQ